MLRFRPRGDLRRDAGGEMMYFEDGMFLLFFFPFFRNFLWKFWFALFIRRHYGRIELIQ